MGWVKRLPDGRYRAFESEGSGADRIRGNAIGRTRTEARLLAAARVAKKRREAALEPHTLTLAAYLKRWMTHLKTQGRGAKSLARYESICDRIPAAVAQRKLADLRPLQLQKWIDDAKLAAATRRKQYAVLHAALAQAVAWRLLIANPMDSVAKPALEPSEQAALGEAETAALITKLQGTRYWAPAIVAATAGLRRGELLALRWRDVDLEAATLRVHRRADEVPGKPVAFKEGTKPSKPGAKPRQRTITLMGVAVAALRAHKKAQAADKLKAKRWHEHGLIFPGKRGEPWRPSSFSVGWGRLATGVRFHDLRHTHATLLLRSGVPTDAVAKRLGHSSPVVTMTVYAHVLEDADAAAVERLEASLGTAIAENRGTEVGTS